MDEQLLFDRVHEALNVEPRPGAYDRMRTALSSRPIKAGRRPRFVWWPRWSPAGMKFAAAAVAVVVTIAAIAAIFDLRSLMRRSSPAGPETIQAYQAMTQRDWGRFASTGKPSCSSLQSVCPAPGQPVYHASQRWLDDLGAVQPPARFAVIDGQLRRHLAVSLTYMDLQVAAYKTKDQAGFDRVSTALIGEVEWVDDVAQSIIASQPATAAVYLDYVRTGDQNIEANPTWSRLIGPAQGDCVHVQAASCQADIEDASGTIEPFEASLVRVAAPDALAVQDGQLRRDLAEADSALLAMTRAQVNNDQAGLTAGRLQLAQALPAIKVDIAAMPPA